jgi:4-hydroxy-tetrahydrodipicolinate synthase
MTAKTNFRGSFTALVTPFKNGAVDEQAFRNIVDWQIAEGTNGLVPVGTTGESPTLSHDEHKQVVEWCVDQADGRVPVVAGAGSNSTSEAVDLARHAEKAGASAVLVVTPLLQQADAGGHVPALQGDQRRDRHSDPDLQHPAALGGRHVGRHHEAALRVEEHRRREGRDRQHDARDAAARRLRAGLQPAFGEDITALGFNAHGGHGCISVTSNVAPRLCSEFQAACGRGDYAAALKLQDKLHLLHINLFCETSPAPVKYAMSMIGKCSDEVRLPMVPASDNARTAVREAMVHAGLIN